MATIEQGIEQLEGMFVLLEDERDRLGDEVIALHAARTGACFAFPVLCLFDVGELETRANAQMTLINIIENFAARLPGLVEVAETSDPKVLNRMLLSTQKVLQAVNSTSAVDEVWNDVNRLVVDLVDSAINAATPPPSFFAGIGAGLVAVAAVLIATR